MKQHWGITLPFIGYNLFIGATVPGIDNAAHVGGLVAGLVAGFTLAAPFGTGARPAVLRAGAGVAACVAAILVLAMLAPNTRQAWDAELGFGEEVNHMAQEEKALVARAREILVQADKRAVAQAETGRQLDGVARSWSGVHARLAAYPLSQKSRFLQTRQDLVEYSELRRQAFTRLARGFSASQDDSGAVAEFRQLMAQGDAVTARMAARNKSETQKQTRKE